MAQYLELNPKLFAVDFVGEQDLLHAITTRPDAWTSIVSPSGEGMSLTYRLRR